MYPELVAHSADGQMQSVKYQVLDSMLLNEVQKQRRTIEVQNETLKAQGELLIAQTEAIRRLESRLAELENLNK